MKTAYSFKISLFPLMFLTACGGSTSLPVAPPDLKLKPTSVEFKIEWLTPNPGRASGSEQIAKVTGSENVVAIRYKILESNSSIAEEECSTVDFDQLDSLPISSEMQITFTQEDPNYFYRICAVAETQDGSIPSSLLSSELLELDGNRPEYKWLGSNFGVASVLFGFKKSDLANYLATLQCDDKRLFAPPIHLNFEVASVLLRVFSLILAVSKVDSK